MNKKALHTLEFDKIIDRLTGYAGSDKGREYCEKLCPISDIEKIKQRQKETGDALARIIRDGSVSFSGCNDPGFYLKRTSAGGSLSMAELLKISYLLKAAGRVRKYGTDTKEERRDTLSGYFDSLVPLTPLADEITRCILSEDEMADDASPGLKNARRQIGLLNEKIRSVMNSMLSNASVRDHLQEAVITVRQGRYCFPVRSEFKSQFPGMVHDQSGSGATLFIEPAAVVEINNELREAELAEMAEQEKVLASLSAEVSVNEEDIRNDFYTLSELDFIFAKGMMASDMNGMEPVLNVEGRINLRKARHPLLDPKKVVPIDVNLGDEFDQLIITGPNTGGKTVSLKTVGLLTVMAQAGLHIPAGDRSELAVFNDVYADIGDEQSIEQSLSTFSSHMTNIVYIMGQVDSPQKANRQALVLFDELCAGTDPSEGAALATAILSKLHRDGIRTMATTHYPELKVYALSTDGVENASCEFSLETLSPTYRLLIGIPGKSNAFAISGKLGLPQELIDDASSRMEEGDRSFEDLISDLEEKRLSMEEDRDTIRREKQAIEDLKKQTAEAGDAVSRKKDDIIKKANLEAAQILKEAKEKADEVIRNFNKYGNGHPDMAKLEKERMAIGDAMREHAKRGAAQADDPNRKKTDPKKLKIGDDVMVLSMNLKGTVHTLPDDRGNFEVMMGIMRSKVNIKDVALIEESKPSFSKGKNKRKVTATGSYNKSATMSPELMLLGMNSDEAIQALDKYLDDAVLAHLETVRIVHGKGTGVLRKAVHDYLRRQKRVSSFHLGEFGEGDSGVTIVEL